jgi:endoglucanase
VAAAGAADAAGHPAARDGLLDSAEALDRRFPTYYGAAWVALGRILLTTKLLDNTCS